MHLAGIFRTKTALISAVFFFVAAVMAGCAGPDAFGGSHHAVEEWSRSRGFASVMATPVRLPIFSLARGNSAEILHVYIEGDGAPWATPFHPPRDPTPEKPVSLALAALDPAPVVVYLGRPCQYLDTTALRDCAVRYWTTHRFSHEVVQAYHVALDELKKRFGAQRIKLFGYSGGGVIATLLAGQRDDVVKLVTIASPIAVTEWVAWHKVSPLVGSLDPANELLKRLPPATHFVGEKDGVVPAAVVSAFAARSGGRLRVVPDFDHQCCWSRDWPRLLEETQ